MFSLSARRDARPEGSALHQRQPPRSIRAKLFSTRAKSSSTRAKSFSTRAKSFKTATRHPDQQGQQVSASLISFPPFDLAQTLHDTREYLDAVTAERNSSQKEVVKPSEDIQQTNQKSQPLAKESGQGQATSSETEPTSGPPSAPKSKPRPRKLSLSHVRRPSKSQPTPPTPDPRLSALGPMATGIAVDD